MLDEKELYEEGLNSARVWDQNAAKHISEYVNILRLRIIELERIVLSRRKAK